MRIIGVVLPPSSGENVKNIVDDFSPTEMKNLKLAGKPIMVDHEEGTEVGVIETDWINEGKKYISARIREDTVWGYHTCNRIAHRALSELSLTHEFSLFQNSTNGQLYYTKEPKEVSVVREGRRINCHILSAIFDREENRKRKTGDLYNKTKVNDQNKIKTIKVSASITSRNMEESHTNMTSIATGNQPTPMGFDDIDKESVMKHALRTEHEKALLESQYKQTQIELENTRKLNEQLQNLVKQEQETRRNQFANELNAAIATAVQVMGKTEDDPQVKNVIEPFKSCSASSMEESQMIGATQLVQGLVFANKNKEEEVRRLTLEVERVRKEALFQNYAGATGFGNMSNRFSTTPEVKVPTFFQPQVAIPSQTTPAPVQEPPKPTIPVVSAEEQLKRQQANYYYNFPHNPFVPVAHSTVKASVQHTPSPLQTYTPPEVKDFPLSKMFMYSQPTTYGTNPNDICGDIFTTLHKK